MQRKRSTQATRVIALLNELGYFVNELTNGKVLVKAKPIGWYNPHWEKTFRDLQDAIEYLYPFVKDRRLLDAIHGRL